MQAECVEPYAAHALEPDALTAELSWTDDTPLSGTSYYYLRAEQRDDEVAWSSPIWVSPASA